MNGQPLAGALPIVAPDSHADRLTALFETHHERLYRLARRLSVSADDALDLVQETFLKAARSTDRIPMGLSSEEAWLVRVLVNIQRDHWRKASVRKRFDSANQSIDPGAGPEAELVARATVWRALDALTPRRRAVVVMRELEGLSVTAIASLLGVTAITVRWHLSMGRRDLTRALMPDRRNQ